MLKIPQINGHVFNGSSIIFCLKECSGKQRKCNLSAATSSRLDGSVTTSLRNESLHLTASPEENGVTADTGLAPPFLSLRTTFPSWGFTVHSCTQLASGSHYERVSLRTQGQGPTAHLEADTGPKLSARQVPGTSSWAAPRLTSTQDPSTRATQARLPQEWLSLEQCSPQVVSGTGLEQ